MSEEAIFLEQHAHAGYDFEMRMRKMGKKHKMVSLIEDGLDKLGRNEEEIRPVRL